MGRRYGLLGKVSVVLVIVVMLGLAGCAGGTAGKKADTGSAQQAGGSEKQAGATPAEQAGRESGGGAQSDKLVLGITPDPTSVDPRVAWSLAIWGPMQLIFEPLLFRDQGMNLKPMLAERWEQVDDTRLRFYLRKDVKFHNGEKFNAEAVKYSLESYLDESLKFTQKGFRAFLSALDHVEIDDEYTVILVTKYPSRSLLTNLTIFNMVPPKQAAADGEQFGFRKPAGTGPYKFAEYVPGTRLVVERNQEYWGTPGKAKTIEIRFLPEQATRVAALESGEVAAINNLPPDSIERIENLKELKVLSAPTTRVVYVEMMIDRPPFDNVKVRQALNYAVDRKGIVDSLFHGLAEAAASVYSPAIPGYNDELPAYPHDPAKAKALLADAGYPNGVKIKFGYPSGRYLNDKTVGEAVTAQLEEAGFIVKAETGEWGTYFANARSGKYDAYILALGTPTVDPAYAMIYFDKDAPSQYNDPEVIQLLRQGDTTFDEKIVLDIYRKAQEIVWDRGPWAALYFQPELVGVRASLQGFAPRADEYLLFQYASLKK